jgi:hypothetical protein
LIDLKRPEMKSAVKLFVILCASCVMLSYSGCKKKPPEPEPITDQQLDILTKGTWKATAVTLGGVAQTGYTGFQITFTGTKGQTTFQYASTGRPALSAWESSGTLTFDAVTPATTLGRDDGVTVTYGASSTQLTMSFQYNGNGYSRVGEVSGQWAFTFSQ